MWSDSLRTLIERHEKASTKNASRAYRFLHSFFFFATSTCGQTIFRTLETQGTLESRFPTIEAEVSYGKPDFPGKSLGRKIQPLLRKISGYAPTRDPVGVSE